MSDSDILKETPKVLSTLVGRAKLFFKYENGKYKCEIDNCEKIISGTKGWNLVSHVKNVHEAVFFSEVSKREKNRKYYAIKRLKFIQDCAELVTKNGRPFSLLKDSGLGRIAKETTDLLKTGGCNINLNDGNAPEVKKYVKELAQKVRAQIKEEVVGKYLSVMLDIVSKNNHSILGIHIQFVVNGILEVRCIGMCQLTRRHKAAYILDVLKKCLEDYNINTRQLISVTTDNGSNMLSMVNKLNAENEIFTFVDALRDDQVPVEFEVENLSETPETSNQTEYASQDQEFYDDASDEEIQRVLNDYELTATEEEIALEAILNGEVITGSFYEEELESLAGEISSILITHFGIKCAAHTVQLSVWNALRKSNITSVIALYRVIAKTLKNQKNQYELMEMGIYFKIPRIDCLTRWSSTYTMVKYQSILFIFPLLYQFLIDC